MDLVHHWRPILTSVPIWNGHPDWISGGRFVHIAAICAYAASVKMGSFLPIAALCINVRIGLLCL
ncbi:MAG: hypothetical protein OSA52_13420, partial [Yoonia sp.]|nr:hypothetical protein [Yoonia sp.]